MKKYRISFISILLIGFIAFNFSINAQTWPPAGMQGNGTENSPWEITTPAHLKALADYVNAGNGYNTNEKYYKLMNDINLSGYANWNPIGNHNSSDYTTIFQGFFNGNGKKMQNLTINRPTENNIGLFGRTYGNIKNIGIENCIVVGNMNVGGLVGNNDYSDIDNCYSTGSIKGSNNYVGGLVGFNYVATITNCYSTAKVSGGESVGGLVGYVYLDSYIINCYATGEVKGSNNYIGGLVGRSPGHIFNCVAANDSIILLSTNTLINRIAGSGNRNENNYALNDMVVQNIFGDITIEDGLTTIAGKGMDMSVLQSFAFYNTSGYWYNTEAWDINTSSSVWDICDGKTLPWLRYQKIDCNLIGINENIISAEFSIYPNPTLGKFIIDFDGTASIKLYDMIGKEVLTRNASGKTEIDIFHLPKGIYFVNIFSEGKYVVNSKIVKQ